MSAAGAQGDGGTGGWATAERRGGSGAGLLDLTNALVYAAC